MNKQKPIILFGSSYSASLALLIATETDQVNAVIAFSPGEYLKGIQLAQQIESITIPIFVTSPKTEIQQVEDVVRYVNKKYVSHFKPEVDGFHGSKALWSEVEGHETYWNALKKFLSNTTFH